MSATGPPHPDHGGLVVAREVGGDRAGALAVAGLAPDDPRNPVRAYLNRLSPGSKPAMLSSLATVTALACGLEREEFASLQAFQRAARAAAFTLPWWLLGYEHTKELRAALVTRYQPSTTNRHLAALRGVLKESWRLELMGHEQYARAADLESVGGSTVEMERLVTQGELGELFNVCAADPRLHGPRDATLLTLLAAAGLRCNETLEVDVGDYDQDAATIRVTHGKGHQQRLVPLDRGAQAALRGWLELRGRLPDPDRDGRYPLLVSIPKGGRRLNPRRLTVARVNRILDERAHQARIPAFTAHDLRRTLGGDMLDDNVDLSTVQKFLGHASPVTTANHYDRRGERAKQTAAQRRHTPYVRWRGDQATAGSIPSAIGTNELLATTVFSASAP